MEWQKNVVGEEPKRFLRGLLHSDGSRFVNRVMRKGKVYPYVRYTFVNESAEIMNFCRGALDQLGIAWRMARPNTLSVARRETVARLDQFVGPKW